MNSNSLTWRTASRLAFRDLAAARGKFLFIAFAIAVGVGSLAGVRGFSRAFRTTLHSEARTLMAADLSLRVFELPTEPQIQALDSLVVRGAQRTQITETISMLITGPESPPALVAVKAVDPALYPFYGNIKLDPPLSLREALTPDRIAVSDDLFIRFPLKTGDRVRLGEAEFTIAAVIRSEPDRMAGSANFGSRVLLSRAALLRTGLVKPGSRSAQRHLLKLDPARLDVTGVREELKAAFPTALVADFRETHPLITRGLERSERFLSLVSLIALIIGALGVAATMHAHLRQRLDTIAIMKCLGARSSQVSRIYLVQTLAVGLGGGVAGCLLGAAVQAAFPLLLGGILSVRPAFHPDPLAALEAVTIGLLTAALFTWPVLLGIREIRPIVIFRRDMADPTRSWRERWFHSPAPWIARGVIAVAIAAIAAWLAGQDRLRVGGMFAGGLLASLLLLGAFSWLLLLALRRAGRTRFGVAWRQGIANVHRPGNQAQAVVVALGIGVMFTLTVWLLQHGMLRQILANAPPDMPNVFMLNITRREFSGIEDLLRTHKSIQGTPEIVPTAAARLSTVNGTPIESMKLQRGVRRFEQARAVTFSNGPRPNSEAVSGAWWTTGNAKPKQVCVLEDTARALNIAPGSSLSWTAGLQTIEATVVCVYKTEEVRMGGNMDFIFSPGTLDRVPIQYFAALRIPPREVASFQRASFERFPSVMVINGADVIELVQQVVDQIALVVRFISGFAILAGVIILAASVAATRFRRIKEVAILKTLGATRRRVASIFAVEFLILGAAAGLLGSILATVFSNLLLTRLMEAKALIEWMPALTAIVLSALVANAAGWLASARLLSQKPLEVLRHE